jgi:hypothetical protein
MDLWKALKELHLERQRLDRVIATLEALDSGDEPKSRRGRKSMPPDERRVVSERMRKYWATRRKRNRAQEASISQPIAVGY